MTDPTAPTEPARQTPVPMSIRRAMPTVHTGNLRASREFNGDFLGFEVGMDEPDFLMLRSATTPTTQLILAGDGAADRKVCRVNISIEVSDVDSVHAAAQRRGLEILYPLTDALGRPPIFSA